jgi:hypothetical protein
MEEANSSKFVIKHDDGGLDGVAGQSAGWEGKILV